MEFEPEDDDVNVTDDALGAEEESSEDTDDDTDDPYGTDDADNTDDT